MLWVLAARDMASLCFRGVLLMSGTLVGRDFFNHLLLLLQRRSEGLEQMRLKPLPIKCSDKIRLKTL